MKYTEQNSPNNKFDAPSVEICLRSALHHRKRSGTRVDIKKKRRLWLMLIAIFIPCAVLVSAGLQVSRARAVDPINVAAAVNGGVATASSTEEGYDPEALINGDRKGLNLTNGGGWRDDTPGAFPDWVQIEFAGPMSIDEVNVITQQDAWWNPVEPTLTLPFYNNGVTSFEVQYWNGTTWLTIPGLSITNNDKVWRKLTFPDLTTDRIRVVTRAAKLPTSTLVEVEVIGTPVAPPNPSPTPTPSPTPNGSLEAALAAREIYFDQDNNVGFGTHTPIFNDDGTTGAFVGRFVAIDGRLTGAAAYLGLGGNVPTPGDRVGVLSFYNIAMGGVDNRTAGIYSFNGPQLGTGVLEFATSPNFIGPVRRMQIGPTGEVGINHLAGAGTQLTVMGRSTSASTKALSVVDGSDRGMFVVRDDGQVEVSRPGQGIVLRSPNGFVCRKLTITDNGELVIQNMGSCP